jgi:protein-S-isoprenylcysteine O-methyltransferase Ste14
MWNLIRSLTYATLFVGLVLVFLPSRLFFPMGAPPPAGGGLRIVGMIVAGVGAAIVLWCIVTFALIGRGTPAIFDPPRKLVLRGPYRFVRNPMYIGAALAVIGAAIVYRSTGLALYAAAFLLIAHVFVVWYEEPTLRTKFGSEYDEYCKQIARWLPRV